MLKNISSNNDELFNVSINSFFVFSIISEKLFIYIVILLYCSYNLFSKVCIFSSVNIVENFIPTISIDLLSLKRYVLFILSK